MELDFNREQPQKNSTPPESVGKLEENSGERGAENAGSLLGKFKDIESLVQSYENLQSEFTRKSQRLSKLEKQDSEKIADSVGTAADLERKNATVQNGTVDADKNADNADIADNAAAFSKSILADSVNDALNEAAGQQLSDIETNNLAWEGQVENFLDKNPLAKKFANEIVDEISRDKDLSNSQNSLEIAFSRVLANRYRSESEIAEDEKFLNDHVLSNEKIIKRVVLNYLSRLQKNATPPVISNSASSHLSLTSLDKPKNLEDAKAIVERMMTKK